MPGADSRGAAVSGGRKEGRMPEEALRLLLTICVAGVQLGCGEPGVIRIKDHTGQRPGVKSAHSTPSPTPPPSGPRINLGGVKHMCTGVKNWEVTMGVQLIIHNPAVSGSHCVTEIKILIRSKQRLFDAIASPSTYPCHIYVLLRYMWIYMTIFVIL